MHSPKNKRNEFRETIPLKRKSLKNAKNKNKSLNKSLAKIKQKSLEQIYEDFWEFIDDNNESFQEFILKDKRRKIRLIPSF